MGFLAYPMNFLISFPERERPLRSAFPLTSAVLPQRKNDFSSANFPASVLRSVVFPLPCKAKLRLIDNEEKVNTAASEYSEELSALYETRNVVKDLLFLRRGNAQR